MSRRRGVADAYGDLRKNLGRVILLGLEVLIIADIIRTIVVDQSVESVAVLGIIVLIRVVLSFSLEVEIDGIGRGTGGASWARADPNHVDIGRRRLISWSTVGQRAGGATPWAAPWVGGVPSPV